MKHAILATAIAWLAAVGTPRPARAGVNFGPEVQNASLSARMAPRAAEPKTYARRTRLLAGEGGADPLGQAQCGLRLG